MMKVFRYLKAGVAMILLFVGGKMLFSDPLHLLFASPFKIPVALSLGVIAAIMTIAIAASLLNKEKP